MQARLWQYLPRNRLSLLGELERVSPEVEQWSFLDKAPRV